MRVVNTSLENGTGGAHVVRGENSSAKYTAGVYGRLSQGANRLWWRQQNGLLHCNNVL